MVEGIDCLLVTVVVNGNGSDTAVAVVTAIVVVMFELTLCDLAGGLLGDGGTYVQQKI